MSDLPSLSFIRPVQERVGGFMQHWDRIEAFVEVVRRGSFAHAARHLGVSSSHVSRLVARLETQLGTQLLYRTTRRLTLTDAGQVYFEHCGQLFDGFQEALAAISDFQQSPTGCSSLPVRPLSASVLSLRW